MPIDVVVLVLVVVVGAALSRGVFQKCSRILDLRVSFDWE